MTTPPLISIPTPPLGDVLLHVNAGWCARTIFDFWNRGSDLGEAPNQKGGHVGAKQPEDRDVTGDDVIRADLCCRIQHDCISLSHSGIVRDGSDATSSILITKKPPRA